MARHQQPIGSMTDRYLEIRLTGLCRLLYLVNGRFRAA